jgi:hypothetical protein
LEYDDAGDFINRLKFAECSESSEDDKKQLNQELSPGDGDEGEEGESSDGGMDNFHDEAQKDDDSDFNNGLISGQRRSGRNS